MVITCNDTRGSGNHEAQRNTVEFASAGSLLPSEPRWDDAMGGEEHVVDSAGAVVASRQFPLSAEDAAAADSLMNADTAAPALSVSGTRLVPIQGLSFDAGVLQAYRYLLRVPVSFAASGAKGEGASGPAPEQIDVVSPELGAELAKSDSSKLIRVSVALHEKPKTSLARRFVAVEAASFLAPAASDRAQRIAARASEVELLHSPLRSRLNQAGVAPSRLVSFWLTGGLAGRLTASEVEALASDPDVRSISLDEPTSGSLANTWDGTNAYVGGTDGLNAMRYWNAGHYGNGWNQVDARYLRLGLVGDGFYFNHSAFRDTPGGPSRFVKNWDCRDATCIQIFTPLGTGTHETLVSSAAGADALEGQVPGVTVLWDQLDRTGVAREARMFSAEGTSHTEMIAALQKMTAEGVDVVNFSRGDYGGGENVCDYDSIVEDWSVAVTQAHDAGVLVVSNAGNVGNPQGTCSITRWAQATSAFVVSGTVDPPDNGYATSARNAAYSIGPMSARVYTPAGTYQQFAGVLTAIDALVPSSWRFAATTPDNFVLGGGTSVAAPQVAGGAMLVKNSFLTNGLTYIDSPGVLFTTMLSMTDRAFGTGATYAASRFDPAWGGGRMQLRYFMGSSDHPAGGAWGFDLWEVMVYNGNVIDIPVRGTGCHPAVQGLRDGVRAELADGGRRRLVCTRQELRSRKCGTGQGREPRHQEHGPGRERGGWQAALRQTPWPRRASRRASGRARELLQRRHTNAVRRFDHATAAVMCVSGDPSACAPPLVVR